MAQFALRSLMADFVKDLSIAKAFDTNPDQFLSERGFLLTDSEKQSLKAYAHKLVTNVGAASHVDVGSHVDVTV